MVTESGRLGTTALTFSLPVTRYPQMSSVPRGNEAVTHDQVTEAG